MPKNPHVTIKHRTIFRFLRPCAVPPLKVNFENNFEIKTFNSYSCPSLATIIFLHYNIGIV